MSINTLYNQSDSAADDIILRLMPTEAGQMNTGTALLNQFPLEVVDLAYQQIIPDFDQLAQQARNNSAIDDDES
jgi:hypothetical protein